jgi:hypothetical protein
MRQGVGLAVEATAPLAPVCKSLPLVAYLCSEYAGTAYGWGERFCTLYLVPTSSPTSGANTHPGG